jgi:hypothetical protein
MSSSTSPLCAAAATRGLLSPVQSPAVHVVVQPPTHGRFRRAAIKVFDIPADALLWVPLVAQQLRG